MRLSATIAMAMAAFAGIDVIAQNPYLPMWEYIPDGEPYVFEDPDNPGHQRVYVYGSHDTRRTDYCGREQVLWSAPVEDLHAWRYEGEILNITRDANNKLLRPHAIGDVLFAPDVAERIKADGTKEYYLYPNNQEGGRNGMVARSNRPDGPFEVINWSKEDPTQCDGVFRFDPAAFVDDDGRAYCYWGFERSYACELDTATMATVRPGTEVIEDLIPERNDPSEFRFFEASSMRKIKDKYVFIYSRWTADGDFGLPQSNYTLAYAYSENPLGPFTYGGTIIDGRGRETDLQGKTIETATPNGNTHGSICQIGDQWYVFYHRQCGLDEFSRQAMVAPITVEVEEGKGGKVRISEGEYTSEGFCIDGLDPLQRYSAGICCWYTGPTPAKAAWPKSQYSGSHTEVFRADDMDKFSAPYDLSVSHNDVVNNTAGSIVGYKYFNFSKLDAASQYQISLCLTSMGVKGTIDVYVDSPWAAKGGQKVGSLQLGGNSEKQICNIVLDKISTLKGKHSLFFVFSSGVKDKSLCTLHDFAFEAKK